MNPVYSQNLLDMFFSTDMIELRNHKIKGEKTCDGIKRCDLRTKVCKKVFG